MATVAGIAMVGTMMAAPAVAIVGGSNLAAVSQPSIGRGQTNQPAGDLTLTPVTPTNTFAASEQIVVKLDDSNTLDANCLTATNFVAFTSAPTVTVSGTATVTSALSASGLCLIAGKTDVLTITFLTAGTATLTISNVRYDIGLTTALGLVVVKATDSDSTLVSPVAGVGNAFVTYATAAANTPPVGLASGTGVQPISNIVVTEVSTDALSPINNPSGRFCVALQGGRVLDSNAPAPTVAVSPAGDTATVALAGGGSGLDVVVTDSVADLTPSVFTVGGLRFNTGTTLLPEPPGLITAVLSTGACGAPVTALGGATTIAAVVTTNRIAGLDRFETAQQLFEGAFPCAPATGLTDAIIARSDEFPDALAASFLAGKLGTGILLVDPTSNTLPAATINALRNRGVDKVTIVGGTAAVPATLANQLGTLPNVNCAGVAAGTITVARIDGVDRFDTARLVAAAGAAAAPAGVGTADYDGTPADPDGAACLAKKTAILATGTNFPDALVAGPVAFNGHNVPGGGTVVPIPGTPGCGDGLGFPVVLTTGNALHPQAASALTALGIEQVLVMGGNTAIDPAVVTAVQAINSITVKRFAGVNRLDTAKQFAEFAIDFLGYDRTSAAAARGDAFPDALAGGPYAGATPANVIVLTESPSAAGTETLAFFRDRQGTVGIYGAPTPLGPVTAVDIFGGTAAVAGSVVSAIMAAISQA